MAYSKLNSSSAPVATGNHGQRKRQVCSKLMLCIVLCLLTCKEVSGSRSANLGFRRSPGPPSSVARPAGQTTADYGITTDLGRPTEYLNRRVHSLTGLACVRTDSRALQQLTRSIVAARPPASSAVQTCSSTFDANYHPSASSHTHELRRKPPWNRRPDEPLEQWLNPYHQQAGIALNDAVSALEWQSQRTNPAQPPQEGNATMREPNTFAELPLSSAPTQQETKQTVAVILPEGNRAEPGKQTPSQPRRLQGYASHPGATNETFMGLPNTHDIAGGRRPPCKLSPGLSQADAPNSSNYTEKQTPLLNLLSLQKTTKTPQNCSPQSRTAATMSTHMPYAETATTGPARNSVAHTPSHIQLTKQNRYAQMNQNSQGPQGPSVRCHSSNNIPDHIRAAATNESRLIQDAAPSQIPASAARFPCTQGSRGIRRGTVLAACSGLRQYPVFGLSAQNSRIQARNVAYGVTGRTGSITSLQPSRALTAAGHHNRPSALSVSGRGRGRHAGSSSRSALEPIAAGAGGHPARPTIPADQKGLQTAMANTLSIATGRTIAPNSVHVAPEGGHCIAGTTDTIQAATVSFAPRDSQDAGRILAHLGAPPANQPPLVTVQLGANGVDYHTGPPQHLLVQPAPQPHHNPPAKPVTALVVGASNEHSAEQTVNIHRETFTRAMEVLAAPLKDAPDGEAIADARDAITDHPAYQVLNCTVAPVELKTKRQREAAAALLPPEFSKYLVCMYYPGEHTAELVCKGGSWTVNLDNSSTTIRTLPLPQRHPQLPRDPQFMLLLSIPGLEDITLDDNRAVLGELRSNIRQQDPYLHKIGTSTGSRSASAASSPTTSRPGSPTRSPPTPQLHASVVSAEGDYTTELANCSVSELLECTSLLLPQRRLRVPISMVPRSCRNGREVLSLWDSQDAFLALEFPNSPSLSIALAAATLAPKPSAAKQENDGTYLTTVARNRGVAPVLAAIGAGYPGGVYVPPSEPAAAGRPPLPKPASELGAAASSRAPREQTTAGATTRAFTFARHDLKAVRSAIIACANQGPLGMPDPTLTGMRQACNIMVQLAPVVLPRQTAGTGAAHTNGQQPGANGDDWAALMGDDDEGSPLDPLNLQAQLDAAAGRQGGDPPPPPGAAAAPPEEVLGARQAVLAALMAWDQATVAAEEAQRLAFEAKGSADDSIASASIRRDELAEAADSAAEALSAAKEGYRTLCKQYGLEPDSMSLIGMGRRDDKRQPPGRTGSTPHGKGPRTE